jgi:hypothetical protein
MPARNKLRVRVGRKPKPSITGLTRSLLAGFAFFAFAPTKPQISSTCRRSHLRLWNTLSWYQAAACPASTTSLLTVVLLTPVNRVTARMLVPSQRRWMILALADAHHAGRFGETDHIGSVSRVRALVNPPYFQTETLPTLSMR